VNPGEIYRHDAFSRELQEMTWSHDCSQAGLMRDLKLQNASTVIRTRDSSWAFSENR
jgi:hypothetical protein